MLRYDGKKLPDWNKQVLHKLIDKEMSIEELAAKIGRAREYTSAIVYGRAYSEPVVKMISDALDITPSVYSDN